MFSLGCSGHRALGFNEPGALCSPCHTLRGWFDALEPETKRVANFWSRSVAPDPHVVLGMPRPAGSRPDMSTPHLHCPGCNKTDEWAFQLPIHPRIRSISGHVPAGRPQYPQHRRREPRRQRRRRQRRVLRPRRLRTRHKTRTTQAPRPRPQPDHSATRAQDTGAQHQNSHGTTHSGGWTPTRGRNPTGYNSSSTPSPNTHTTTSNTTCLPCNDDNDSGSDSGYEERCPLREQPNDDLDDEESSICRKIKIHLNEIDIPDWTSIVFDRLR
jgi:hypothetical protein